MDEGSWRMIAAAILAMSELYAIQPWKFPVMAKTWDVIARLAALIADFLGWVSIKARSNYFTAVESYGN